MENKLKENIGIYSVGLCTAIIVVFGVLANSLYAELGGYGVGFAICAIILFAQCFLFSIAVKLAKVRMKGELTISCIITSIYAVLFILSDLAGIEAMNFTVDGTKPVRNLLPLGTFGLIFAIVSFVLLIAVAIRLFANLAGKEFNRIEKMLGTQVVRRQQGEVANEELPRKDTDKLFSDADQAFLASGIVVKDLARATQGVITPATPTVKIDKEDEDDIGQVPYEQLTLDIPDTSSEEAPAAELITITDSDKPNGSAPEDLTTPDDVEVVIEDADYTSSEVAQVDDDVIEKPYIDSDESASGYVDDYQLDDADGDDMRQDYAHSRVIQKEAQNDDIYVDFSYGTKKDDA